MSKASFHKCAKSAHKLQNECDFYTKVISKNNKYNYQILRFSAFASLDSSFEVFHLLSINNEIAVLFILFPLVKIKGLQVIVLKEMNFV